MSYSSKEAMDYLLKLKWEVLFPLGFKGSQDVSSKTKAVIFRIPKSNLELAITPAKKFASCVIPFRSVGGNQVPVEDPNKCILDTDIEVVTKYPLSDGSGINTGVSTNAPSLRINKEPRAVHVRSKEAFNILITWLTDGHLATVSNLHVGDPQLINNNEYKRPMNTILYGPPGTGKTFKTAELAVKACDGKVPETRKLLMERYEELCKEERISFVTFHQSYGYEDFVEGLRPEMQDKQVSYRVRPGIFREICDVARRSTLVRPGLNGAQLKDKTIYKMSLGIAGTTEGKLAFQECIEKGYILLGYGSDIDFSECKTEEEIRKKVEDEDALGKPESHARYMTVFKEELKVGDIVVISQGNLNFRAVGEVTGEYEFLEAPVAGNFHQMRTVRWLAVLEGNHSVKEIYNRKFMQSSLYKLDPDSLRLEDLEKIINGQQKMGDSNKAFILIIDEINRANISKVFGELITLLEPDKREGEMNALTVKLPYSGLPFCVPSNLHVIGTMNTADRSIALLDTALRRRFEFEELQPDHTLLDVIDGVDLSAMLEQLNKNIEYLYDRDHTIGHAYFINVKTLSDLDVVFRRKVIPLLQEYFYEDIDKVRLALNDDGGFFTKETLSAPKVKDEYESKFKYTVKDQFPLQAYLNIYQ